MDPIGPKAGSYRTYGLRTAAGDVGQVAICLDGSAVEPGLRCPWSVERNGTGETLGVRRLVSGSRCRPWLGLASCGLPFATTLLCLAASLADVGHVGTISAHHRAAFLSGLRGFLGIEAVGFAVSVGGASAL